jgi:RND family efflux transporter MFP subunit
MKKTPVVLLSIGILLGAIIGAKIFIKTAPKARQKPLVKTAEPVQVLSVKKSEETVVLHLSGTVRPAEQIVLLPQVSGEIISVSDSFVDGGHVQKGTILLQIDPADYELARAKAASALATARFNYQLELGRQAVAKREWEMLKTKDATPAEEELALRKPHLKSSKAALDAAKAQLEKAERDLERVQIKAPFNATILRRQANVGAIASPQSPLAELAGTDVYWVQVSIPLDRLKWISIPGSSVKIVTADGRSRTGKVIELLGSLEERGRMARLLVEIGDPLCLRPENQEKPPLLIGEYVEAQVSGKTVSGVFWIPRLALREGDVVWIEKEGVLEIRKVETLWRDAQNVLIKTGLFEGDRLVVSGLSAPVPGMALQELQIDAPEKALSHGMTP